MTRTDGPGVVDALGLVPLYGDEVVLQTVRDTHRAIAHRAYGALGRPAGVPRLVHDGIAETVYAGVGAGLAAAGAALKAVGRGPSLNSPTGSFVQSAVAGIVGDRLRDDDHPLHFEMTVRLRGEDIPLDPANLAAAFSGAAGRVIVFVHGLCENESSWRLGGRPTYGSMLEREGWTPVFLRVNTGLTLRENGVALASLMQSLVDAWPVRVERIAMVGHSMGGLVIRAGCGVAGVAEQPWTGPVTDVITLGTPHLGAPLARQARLGAAVLKAVPEAAAFGRIIDHRSVGISDLEKGLLDACDHEHIRFRLVSASLGKPWGILLGDLLVGQKSAHGRPRRSPELFPGADVVHLPNTNHFGLLNHPDVHVKLKEWLR